MIELFAVTYAVLVFIVAYGAGSAAITAWDRGQAIVDSQ